MADAYLGEIRMFAGNFAPSGWAFCNGQLLPISQNTTLYAVIGVQYGGDGKSTFALPNLNGSAPMHQGTGAGLTSREVGDQVGQDTVTLLVSEMPAHTHAVQSVADVGSYSDPTNNYWAEANPQGRSSDSPPVFNSTPNTMMSPNALAISGGSQPHNNMQPFLALNFIICLEGYFPPKQ